MVDSQKYRIRRSRGGRGTIWELQIWQEDNTLPPFNRHVRPRNQSPYSAAFANGLQKRFWQPATSRRAAPDEFARATVSDRKKVLADILDLSRYERLEEMAKEKRKEAEDKELDAERQLNTIDTQLESEDAHHFALEAAQKRLIELQTEAQTLREGYEKLRGEIEQMEAKEEQAKEWEAGIVDREEANRRDERDRAELIKRITQAQTLTAQAAHIEQQHARFVEITADLVLLEQQFREQMALQTEAQRLDNLIQAEHSKFDRERYKVDCDVQNLLGEAKEENRYLFRVGNH